MFAFSSFLVLLKVFFVPCTTAPHLIIKGIAIWGVRQQDVRGDVVAEILTINNGFSCLCSKAKCPVAKCRVFQQPLF